MPHPACTRRPPAPGTRTPHAVRPPRTRMYQTSQKPANHLYPTLKNPPARTLIACTRRSKKTQKNRFSDVKIKTGRFIYSHTHTLIQRRRRKNNNRWRETPKKGTPERGRNNPHAKREKFLSQPTREQIPITR
jgi:hypothetical protein